MVVFEWHRQLHQLAHFLSPGACHCELVPPDLGSIASALEIKSVPSDENDVLVSCPCCGNETTFED